jgi:hypothetical protein
MTVSIIVARFSAKMKAIIINKGVIRICKSKDRHNDQKKGTKGQTIMYKTLHRKLKIEQHEPH